jgi:prepilin-type N-terminal cleavage/methylation domain-containing protein
VRTEEGLTLVELMITLAVIAILAGVGTPYLLVNLPVYRVNAATRQMVADFRLARTMAVERGLRTYLEFDAAAGTYALAVDEDGDETLTSSDPRIKTVRLEDLYSGIEFGRSDPGDAVTFDSALARFAPTGTSNGGAVYLRPAHDSGIRRDRDRRVTVMSTTGRARAQRWNGSTWE